MAVDAFTMDILGKWSRVFGGCGVVPGEVEVLLVVGGFDVD